MDVVIILPIPPQQTRLKPGIFLFGGFLCLLNQADKPAIKSPLVGREGLCCLGIRWLHPGFASGCWWLYLCKFNKVRFFSFPCQLAELQSDGVRLSLDHHEIYSMKPGSRRRCRKTRLFKKVGRDGGGFIPLHNFLPRGINVTRVLSLSWWQTSCRRAAGDACDPGKMARGAEEQEEGAEIWRGQPGSWLGRPRVPTCCGHQNTCSCSISLALVLPHKGFVTGPITGEDTCEKAGNSKPPLDVPAAERQVLKRVVAQERKP